LRGNYLTHIKSDIQYLYKLQVLDIRDNWIHSVPKSLGELSNLRTFLAGHNLLRTFSGFFYKNRDLVELDLSYNLFTELPIQHGNIELLRDTNEWEVGIGLLTSLTNLNLSHNIFTEWPKQIERLTILQTFDMSHNRLSAISPLIASNSGDSLTHSLNQSLTHSLTRSLTHLLTNSLTYLLTYSLTYLLTHSYRVNFVGS
jgi:Leucine-rich repeat (LRR) protein